MISHSKIMQIKLKQYISDIFLIIIIGFVAQNYAKADTDSLKISTQDSIAKIAKARIDSLGPKPFKLHGSISQYDNLASFQISKKEVLWENYFTFADLAASKLPVFPITLSTPGEYNSFSIFGGLAINNAASYNGRNIGDYDYGSYNFAVYSPEAFEKAEFYIGSDAVIFSGNSGAYVNFQEIIYNTAKPYTRLAYSQGGAGQISADGVYSQNVAERTNFTFGFKNNSSDGRFTNSALNSWNVRTTLRYNIDSLSSVSFTENFVNHGAYQNGGINPVVSEDIFNPNTAGVYYSKLKENQLRHDLTLTYSNVVDTSGLLAFQSSVYASFIENNKNYKADDILLKFDSSGSRNYSYSYFGVAAKMESKYHDYVKLIVGAEANVINFTDNIFIKGEDGLDMAVYGRGELSPVKQVKLSGGARIRNVFGNTLISVGVRSTFEFTDNLNLIVDASRSEAPPSFAQGSQLTPEENLLGISYLNYHTKEFSVSGGGFARKVNNPIVGYRSLDGIKPVHFDNCDCETVYGGFVQAETKLTESLNYKIEAQSYYSVGDTLKEESLPGLYLKSKIEYHYKIGRSELFAGVSVAVISPFRGFTYFPLTKEFIYNEYKSDWKIDGGSIYAHLKLGDAYLKVNFDNLLDIGYAYVPGYPYLGRNFHVGLFWPFGN